jgi:hypothetical protein
MRIYSYRWNRLRTSLTLILKMTKQLPLLLCIFSLLVGGVLYFGFRPESLVMFKWVKMLGFYGVVSEFRRLSAPIIPYLPKCFIFTVPNGLWVFSFGSLMAYLWGPHFRVVIYWTFALWVVGVVSEVMQFTGKLPGVFDMGDLAAYTLGFFGVLLFFRRGEGQCILE